MLDDGLCRFGAPFSHITKLGVHQQDLRDPRKSDELVVSRIEFLGDLYQPSPVEKNNLQEKYLIAPGIVGRREKDVVHGKPIARTVSAVKSLEDIVRSRLSVAGLLVVDKVARLIHEIIYGDLVPAAEIVHKSDIFRL